MKRFVVVAKMVVASLGLLAASTSTVAAQQPGGMDPAEMMRRLQDPAAMQRMIKEAEAAQRCMEGIDQSKLEALQRRGRKMGDEIDALCKEGKKDEALAKGLSFYKEVRSDPTILKLRECAKDMTEMVESMGLAEMPGVKDESEPTRGDICS